MPRLGTITNNTSQHDHTTLLLDSNNRLDWDVNTVVQLKLYSIKNPPRHATTTQEEADTQPTSQALSSPTMSCTDQPLPCRASRRSPLQAKWPPPLLHHAAVIFISRRHDCRSPNSGRTLTEVSRGAHRTTPKEPPPCRTPRRSTAAAPYATCHVLTTYVSSKCYRNKSVVTLGCGLFGSRPKINANAKFRRTKYICSFAGV